MNHLRLDGGFADGGRGPLGLQLRQHEFLRDRVRGALYFETPVNHQRLGEFDGGGIGGVQIEHRGGRAGVECFLAFFAQKITHGDGDIAEVDIDRTRVLTFVANGAVVGNVRKFIEVP